MRTRIFTFLLLLLAMSAQQLIAVDRDSTSTTNRYYEKVMVLPEHLLPGTPVFVVLHYMSTDGCPDYVLVKDSVIDLKVYISKKLISDSTRVCTQVITPFKTVLELGVPAPGTEIYVDGKLIRTIKFAECRPNRIGVVEAGTNTCEGRLLVRDISNLASSVFVARFALPATEEASKLKAGDKIKFASLPVPRDTTKTDSCKVQGVVTCFELIVPEPAFTLSGVAIAGTDTVLYGRAVLIGKKKPMAVAQTAIVNGKYVFANTPQGEYTIFVSPDRRFYQRYLPTFYVNKLRIKEADYFMLNQDLDTISVMLAPMKTRTGKGRVDGKVTYENDKLRDSVYTNRPQKAPAADAAYDVTVMLIDRSNNVVASTQTDENGRFAFPDISTEGYRIVCETTTSEAETAVSLTSTTTAVSVDLVLRAPADVTAVSELTTGRMTVAPTEVSGFVNVALTEAAELVVYSMQGQQVMKLQLEAGTHQLSTEALQTGMHLIAIPGEVHKIVKR